MRIVILGAPGSGKRTQTALLSERLNLSAVTTGELLKTAIAEQNPLGLEAKALQDAGRAVTEDIILGVLREHFLTPGLSGGFLLDGFPRNLLQALTLDEVLLEIDQPLDLVLLIDIETDTLMERLVGRRTCRSCGLLYNAYRNPPIVDGVCDACGGRLHRRSDDNEETVSNRIHVFDHLIAPLITHYTKSDKLVRVDGNGEIKAVFKAILAAIDEHMRRPVEPVPAAPAEKKMSGMEADESAEEKSASARRPVKQKKPVQKTASKPKKTHKKKARPSAKKTAKPTAGKRTASSRKVSAAKAEAAKPKVSAGKQKSGRVKKTATKKKPLKASGAKVGAKKAGVKKRVVKKAVAKKAVVKKAAKVTKKTAKQSAPRPKKKVVKKSKAAATQKKTVRKTTKKAPLKRTAGKKKSARKKSSKKR